jgi:GT2 family glycosyltransferase
VKPAASDVTVVVPTVGRPSVGPLLKALGAAEPGPAAVVLVDDRRAAGPLPVDVPPSLHGRVQVVRGRAAGPAAARNDGWRRAATPWVAFLDDDVEPVPGWFDHLLDDLVLPEGTAACQGRVEVPLPAHRRPTDWERNVARLQDARWITADLAVRRDALVRVDGFDERFPRAYREDTDLALRLTAAGYRIVLGDRRVLHPVRPAPWWISVRLQAGNADDVLLAALHGERWQGGDRRGGRRRRHVAITAIGSLGLAATLAGRRRLAAAAFAAWAVGTGELAWARIAPGPRDGAEIAAMLATSVALPPAATLHWVRGVRRVRRLQA